MNQLPTIAKSVLRWLFIGLIALCVKCANAQDCCFNPSIIGKDTSFIQEASQVYLLETPANKKYQVQISFKEIVPIVIVNSYDNLDQSMVYSGVWFNGSTTAPSTNGTMAYSNVPGNTVTFTFTGSKIEWLSEFKSTHGACHIIIDNGTPFWINLGSANTGFGVVKSFDLVKGFHTVTIKVLDNKYVIHDGFRVTN